VVLRLDDPIAFDPPSSIPSLGRFVIIDDYQISGGGLIEEPLPDEVTWLREKVVLRDYKWEQSNVPEAQRAERYNQRATLILISGPSGTNRKDVAKALEKRLFEEGKLIYYLGIGSLKYGVDADLLDRGDHRIEHFRRLGEVAHILLDAGILLVVSAQEVHHSEFEVLRTVIDPDQIETIWLGESRPVSLSFDLHIPSNDVDEAVRMIKSRLQDIGAIYRPR
jgi:bifunctional enzyme CysN/CysC